MNGPVLTSQNLTSLLKHKPKNGTGSDAASGRKEKRSDFWMDSITHGQVGGPSESETLIENLNDKERADSHTRSF
jgi:hypothetical protein